MLHRLRVHGFKSLRDVEVDLARLVVVFGPNATGKSNLLEALVLLSRLVQERTLAEAFEEGIRGYPVEAFSFAEAGLEELLRRESAGLTLEARVGSEGGPWLDYRVSVRIRPQTAELSLADEWLQPLTRHLKPHGNPVIERVEDGERTLIRVRRRGRPSHPFEEPVGLHHTLISNLQYSGDKDYPAFDALRHEVGTWRAVYLDPREAMRRSEPPREVEDIGARGQWLVPFLHRLREDPQRRKGFDAIVRATRTVIPGIEDITTELVRTRGEIDLKVKQDGTWMSARVVSEGTLRVLALCAMAASPFTKGLLAFEEPENGVHPRRIEAVTHILAAAARHRQVIVTTHSPLVVGEVVRLVRTGAVAAGDVRLIACSSGPGGSRFRRFDPSGPLFADSEVREALSSPDEAAQVQAMLQRGWLDG
jgi:predicted ATPase